MHPQPKDAIGAKDKVIATQRRCHEEISWYQKKSTRFLTSLVFFHYMKRNENL